MAIARQTHRATPLHIGGLPPEAAWPGSELDLCIGVPCLATGPGSVLLLKSSCIEVLISRACSFSNPKPCPTDRDHRRFHAGAPGKLHFTFHFFSDCRSDKIQCFSSWILLSLLFRTIIFCHDSPPFSIFSSASRSRVSLSRPEARLF